MVLDALLALGAVGLQHMAHIAEGEHRLDAGGDIVGQKRNGAGGRDRVQQRVADAVAADRGAHVLRQAADRLAGEVTRAVVEREAALFGRDVGRREIGQALDCAQPFAGQPHRLGRAIAHAAEDQRIGEASDAEADATLGLGFLVLLRQRETRDVDHVVEHAHRQRHQTFQRRHVQAGLRRERILDQGREIDRAQQAGPVGRQRLLTAVVDVEAIGVEGIDAGNFCIVDLGLAVRFDAIDLDDEPLSIELAPIAGQKAPKAQHLVSVSKADPLGEESDIVTGYRQFVLCRAIVQAQPALAVGHRTLSGRPPITIDRGGNAETKQHALDGLQQFQIILAEANADTLDLRALHRSIGIEQAAQQSAMEIRRRPFHCRCDGLVAWRKAQPGGKCLDGAERQAPLVAAFHFHPARKVRAVRQRPRRRQGRIHDARHAGSLHGAIGNLARLPYADDRLVRLQCAVAQQQAEQIAFGLAMTALPSWCIAMVVQDQLIAWLKVAGGDPPGLTRPARGLRPQHLMICGETQAVPCSGPHPQHLFQAGGKKAGGAAGVGLAIDQGGEGVPGQIPDLARSVRRVHPRIGCHTRVRRLDRLAILKVVPPVDPIDEDHPRLGIVVGRAHDALPQGGGLDGAEDLAARTPGPSRRRPSPPS